MSAHGDGVSPIRLHRQLEAIWSTAPGLGRLAAINHTVVGRRFIITAFVFFLIGGLLAMLLRIQLARPESPFLGPDLYNQIFTMHGTVMMFLFAIPMIEGFAIYMLPKVLGARDMAFPRLSAFGYWCYVIGGGALVAAMAVGAAPNAGWFMYTPLASQPYSPGINSDVWLIGVTFVEVSAVCAAIEILVSVLKVRAPGMALHRMPLLGWYLLVTAAMMIGAFPPLILGSVLLEIERAFGWSFFDPERGGDPLLWQHLFWLFGHPEVYIIFVPAAGVVSTLVPVFARRPIVGYAWLVCAIVALAFLSFGLWVHHMFTTGIPHLSLAFFSAASGLVAVPTGVQIFAWLATLLTGRPELKLPMLYLLGFFFVFVAGGLTGVMVAMVPFDWQLHDTHFIVAHLHYVLIGGFVFPMIAAAYYWLPHLTGRMPVYNLGQWAFWLIFVGFNLTFLIMHLTGLLGMPRRIYTYLPGLGWDLPNLISSLGAFVLLIGIATFVVDIFLQCRLGTRFRRNPWGAGTLEWAMPTPPTSYGFASLPRVGHRDPLLEDPGLPADLAGGRGYLARAVDAQMETLGVEAVSGEPDQIIVYPRPGFLPLYTALAAALFFGGLLFKLYWLSGVGLALLFACVLRWIWSMGGRSDPQPEDIGHGESARPHWAVPSSPVWWGLVALLVADGLFFSSLLFGYFFLFTVSPGWPPAELLEVDWLAAAASVLGVCGAAAASAAAARPAALRSTGRREPLCLAAVAAGLVAMAGTAAVFAAALPRAEEHAYYSTVAALAGYMLLHIGLAATAAAYAWFRSRAGYVSPERATDIRACLAWSLYAVFATVPGLAAIVVLTWTAS